MAVDFDELKKLVPQRRIKELQRLITKLKEEIKERESDISEADSLLESAEQESRILEQMEVPEVKPVKKPKIEEVIEGKIERKKLGQLELEELLETAPARSPEIVQEVSRRPVSELYGELKKIYDRQKETGLETTEDREMLYAIRKGFEIKKEEGYTPATKADKHLMTTAQEWAEEMYKGGAGTYKRTPG